MHDISEALPTTDIVFLIGTQIRSCRDDTFLQTGQLKSRIAKICRDRGLEEPTPDVIAMVSHATQDRLKTLLEKLSVVAEHRMDVIRGVSVHRSVCCNRFYPTNSWLLGFTTF